VTTKQGPDGGVADFDELYARFGPAIYARCRQMLGDSAAAEDLTQEAFLRIHRTLATVRGPREALVWLYRTATNLCLNEIRAGRHRAVPVELLPQHAGPPPEQRLSAQDLVGRVLRSVPEELAIAAWLFHVDGLEQAEIAEICGVSRRTVIARVSRFAARARAFIEESDHDRP
jgi:RNA polymerase sigma-70 factor (ECF subfamily)